MNRALEQGQIFRPVRPQNTPWTFWLVAVVSAALLGPALWQLWHGSNASATLWILACVSLLTAGLVALLLIYPRAMAYRADARGIHVRGLVSWFTVSRADIVKVALEDTDLVFRSNAVGAPGLHYGQFITKQGQAVHAYSSINKGAMVVIYTHSREPVLISPRDEQGFLEVLERLGYPVSR